MEVGPVEPQGAALQPKKNLKGQLHHVTDAEYIRPVQQVTQKEGREGGESPVRDIGYREVCPLRASPVLFLRSLHHRPGNAFRGPVALEAGLQ